MFSLLLSAEVIEKKDYSTEIYPKPFKEKQKKESIGVVSISGPVASFTTMLGLEYHVTQKFAIEYSTLIGSGKNISNKYNLNSLDAFGFTYAFNGLNSNSVILRMVIGFGEGDPYYSTEWYGYESEYSYSSFDLGYRVVTKDNFLISAYFSLGSVTPSYQTTYADDEYDSISLLGLRVGYVF